MIHLIEVDKLEIVTPVRAGNGDLLGNVTLTFTRDDERNVTLMPPGVPAAITISAHDAGYLAAWLVGTAP